MRPTTTATPWILAASFLVGAPSLAGTFVVGDRVWDDVDRDGIQDPGEPGVPGVGLTLRRGSGQVSATTTTGASGEYSFLDVPAGLYYITVTPPENVPLSPWNQGGDDALDSDANPLSGGTSTFQVDGDDATHWDFGLLRTTIGGRVWFDDDEDAVQDPADFGIPGIAVHLLDELESLLEATTTGPAGGYTFVGLTPGAPYRVRFVPPPGWAFVPPDAGPDAADSDADPSSGATALFALDTFADASQWDAGIRSIAVGDLVWHDLDADGLQDEGEPGIANVVVELEGQNFDPYSTLTDANGRYAFPDVDPRGSYRLRVENPPGLIKTLPDRGDDRFDSDVAHTFLTLPLPFSAAVSTDTDVGLSPLGTVAGGYVWQDTYDRDGYRDGSEELPFPGVMVELLGADGTPHAAKVTDFGGRYRFGGLTPGATYRLRVERPDGYFFTFRQSSSSPNNSDVDPATGETVPFVVDDDDDADYWGAGLQDPSIGDHVFVDHDRNGRQDSGEPGVSSVTVELLDADGAVLATDRTGGGGEYGFAGLAEGHGYALRFHLPADHAFTAMDVGGDDLADSDVDDAGQTAVFFWSSIDDGRRWDAGLLELAAKICGRAWLDADRDGRHDSNESGVPDIAIELELADGTPIGTTVTSAIGDYCFDGLTPAEHYVVRFLLPADRLFTRADATHDAIDSDVDPTTGEADVLLNTFRSGQVDAGLVAPLIGDRVWLDTNEDGEQDSGEPGATGIVVELLDAQGVLLEADETDANGGYGFSAVEVGAMYSLRVQLPPGVSFTAADVGSDDQEDSDLDVVTGSTSVFALTSIEDGHRWDAGLVLPPEAICGRVWFDADRDGRQDTAETGVAGVAIELDDDDANLLAGTSTDASGAYCFGGLVPDARYVVRFVRPADRLFALRNVTSDAVDSDADRATGEVVVLLDSVADGRNVDAGLVVPLVGDRVWLDTNENGVQNPGEAGFAGIVVELLDEQGAVAHSATSGSAGEYSLASVVPGQTYRLRVEPPFGYQFSFADRASDDRDSDVDPSGLSPSFVLAQVRDAVDWDVGLAEIPRQIGDRVWHDLDEDGRRDSTEPGLAGVTVELLVEDGQVFATTETSVGGGYAFAGLELYRSYRLRFTAPPGYFFTVPDAGADDTGDSDADPATGETILFPLESFEDDTRWDAGLVPVVSAIGGRVWDDADGNGIQDPGEPSLNGATVELLAEGGQLLRAGASDANGEYVFVGLAAGTTYRVRVVLPFDRRATLQDQGDDDLLDSDVDPVDGMTPPIVLSDALDRVRWDAGLRVGRLTIGDRTWDDVDGDGLQDTGEPGLGGVIVDLLGESGSVRTTASNETGGYGFGGGFAGDRVRLRFRPPIAHVLTMIDAGSDAIDSDADPLTGLTEWFVLEAGDDATRWDAGFVSLLGAAGDRVWKDANGDGVQEPREPGVGGVQVLLFRHDGQLLDLRETDATGTYRFGGLFAAPHYVRFVAPAGFAFTVRDAGVSDDADSDADPPTGDTLVFTPVDADATRWDAGLVHACPFPDRPLEIVAVGQTAEGGTRFDLFDPNDPARVTAYRARRSDSAEPAIVSWPALGGDFDAPAWSDDETPPAGALWLYQFSAVNAACGAEGPW